MRRVRRRGQVAKKLWRGRMCALAIAVVFVIPGGVVLAHWDPGDPYKMHHPQLPDPNGWDLDFGAEVPQLADDWQCTESGWVDDFHFWVSWQGDYNDSVTGVYAAIYADDRTGPYSKPGEELWSLLIKAENFAVRYYGTGDQGWYDPNQGTYIEHDHADYYQINVTDINTPFYQEAGTIYWLGICVTSEEQVGWKTSLDHFEDDAVWWNGSDWEELRDPITDESLDMAFVITPEPATLLLLTLGGVLVRIKRK